MLTYHQITEMYCKELDEMKVPVTFYVYLRAYFIKVYSDKVEFIGFERRGNHEYQKIEE